jgi:diguanylate cyclase (GGDEF)-like protein/PAS domain S-box-containing protein
VESRLYHRLLFRLLALPIASLTLLALILAYALQRVEQSGRNVDHTDRTIAHANYLTRLIVDEETGIRGYLLSKDPVLLQPLHEADQRLPEEFTTLFHLVRRDPAQTAKLTTIQKLHDAWEADAQRDIASLAHSPDFGSRMLERKHKMDRLRLLLDDFIHTEDDIRATRSTAANRIDQASLIVLAMLVALIALLIAWITRKLFRDLTSTYNLQISEVRRHAEDAHAQQQWLNITLRSIGDAVIACDAAGNIEFMNTVAEQLTGWSEIEAVRQPLHAIFRILNEETRVDVESPVDKVRRLNTIVGLANHTSLIARNGDELSIEDSAAPIKNERGELLGVVLVFRDVTEQRRISGEMSHRATHDGLTGLFNRLEFETRLARLLQRVQTDDSQNALLYIDLDQFKIVNDTCGHAVGDLLLCQVAKLLTSTIRTSDTLARLGGDEFAIILEHCPPAHARVLAQRACERINDFRFLHEERSFRIGASVGLVPIDDRWTTASAVMQAADTSCYAAKEAGRNRVHIWSDTEDAVRERQGEASWAVRIEHALEQDRFVLFAQRIKSISGQDGGTFAEVLIRLLDEEGSVVLPGAFLPSAERFHLISRIDRWVLGNVIGWMKSLPSLHFLDCLNVNLSGQSIGDRAFHRWATEALLEAGTEVCGKLCLEITETSAVTSLADAVLFIEQVRALGVRIALDDFGSGTSWFGYLKKMPVDLLKIDGQFIRELVTDPLEEATVRCFADVARAVKVKTVAEFVDNAAALQLLNEIGIDFAQGYLIHKPAPLDQLLNPL